MWTLSFSIYLFYFFVFGSLKNCICGINDNMVLIKDRRGCFYSCFRVKNDFNDTIAGLYIENYNTRLGNLEFSSEQKFKVNTTVKI